MKTKKTEKTSLENKSRPSFLDNVITEKTHPYRYSIIGKPKEQLLKRRPYVLRAISAWKENRYNATPDIVAYNINYFETELKIVDKELARF